MSVNDMTGASAAQFGREEASESDEALVDRARARDGSAFELLMRRHNQRVYRVVRAVLRDDDEIEDVIQQSYMQAFLHLDQFGGNARWSTWLCRIAINEALARLRRRGRFVSIDAISEDVMADLPKSSSGDPERTAARREFSHLVEEAIDGLADIYRAVVIMREVEGMTTEETAAVLEVEPEVVRTRLHRARASLKTAIEDRIGEQMKGTYTFGNERCDRVVAAVLARLDLAR